MYDVIVVGAGLAGLETARLLAEGGASVLLVDARRSVDAHVRTTGIFVRRTFADFRSLDPFLGPAIRTVALHSPAGRTIEVTSGRDEFRVGRMGDLYRERLHRAEVAGVEWRPATVFQSARGDSATDGGVGVTFRDGSRSRSRFVVGADGVRSRVAAHLGLDRNSRTIVGVESVYPSARPGAPRFDCWVDPTIAPGYLAWLLDDGDEVHVGVGGDATRFDPARALRAFEVRLVRERRLSPSPAIERRGGLIPVNGVLRRISCEHGLLVGDAAGAVSPLTAGGLDACMRLSAHAAAVLRRALDDPTEMHAYSGAAYRSRFSSRLGMRTAFDLATRWSPLVELGFAVARNGVTRALVEHVFFGRGSFPDADAVSRRDAVVPPALRTRGALRA